MRLSSLLVPALAASFALAQYGGYGGGYGDDGYGGGDDNGGGDDGSASTDSDDTASTAAASSAAATAASTAAPAVASADSSSSGTTAGKTCTSDMCITAIVNSTTTLYELQSVSTGTPGWMAIGFGQQMANSPMVILWENADGSMTLSQRQAPGEVEPSVVANPPSIATLDMASSDLTSSQKTYAFTIPTTGTTSLQLIWAYSSVNPDSADASAQLVQHDNSGAIVLDASAAFDSGSSSNGTVPATTKSASAPLTTADKLLLAHGVVFVVGFMFLLPTGVLLARWLRTTTIQWFQGHWIIQFLLTAPIMVTGLILAIAGVHARGPGEVPSGHKYLGFTLIILYFVQCALGALIHFVKDPNRKRRPPQNYTHAVLGLAIIGGALFQIHDGYSHQWPRATGRGDVSSGLNVVYFVWVIILILAYVAGMSLLRKQYRMEAAARAPSKEKQFGGAYDDAAYGTKAYGGNGYDQNAYNNQNAYSQNAYNNQNAYYNQNAYGGNGAGYSGRV